MNDGMTIEKMIRLLLYTADRLESYINDGIPVYDPNLNTGDIIVGEDYRIDAAEKRISDRKRNNDKDKELIKNIIFTSSLSIKTLFIKQFYVTNEIYTFSNWGH